MPLLRARLLAHLAALKTLRQLEIVHCTGIDDAKLQGVTLPTQITHLKLHQLAINEATLSRWLDDCKLESLDLDLPIRAGICVALGQQQGLKETHHY